MFQKAKLAQVFFVLFIVIASGCSTYTSSPINASEKGKKNTCPVIKQDETVLFLKEDPAVPFEKRALTRAYAIADFINAKYSKLFAVNYVEVPNHGRTYGVHYSMSVIKRFDLLDSFTFPCAFKVVGHIFRLTTLHVLKSEEAQKITHVGVQLVDPHIWFRTGGHPRGIARLFISSKEKLLTLLLTNIPAYKWVKSAQGYTEYLIIQRRFQ